MSRKFASRAVSKIRRSVIENLELRQMLAGDQQLGCACGCCAMCGNLSPNAHPALTNPFWGGTEGAVAGMTYTDSNSGGGLGIEGAYASPGARWTTTASQPSGASTNGVPVILTYSFVPDGTSVPGYNGEATSNSNLFARMRTIYASFGATTAEVDAYWQGLVHTALTAWGAQAGVTYVRELNDDGAAFGPNFSNNNGVLGVRGDIRISGHSIDGDSNVLAYNFFPNASGGGGDMVIDTNDNTFNNLSNNSRILRNVITHEAGHGLGFNHTDPINRTKLMEAFLATNFDGPQFDDYLVANFRYGDRLETPARNNTTATATVLGTIPIGTTAVNNISLSTNIDVDAFRVTIPSNSIVRLTATPLGTSYLSGNQNAATTTFNALTVQDLRLTVQTSTGAPVITNQNLSAVGVAEVISNLSLNAGDYFFSISSGGGASTTPQMFNFTIERSDPLVPTIAAVSPAPRTTTLNSITVSFNQAINTSTISAADFVLTRDGEPVTLSGVSVSSAGTNAFNINGLTAETSRPGLYVFSLAAGADVQNSIGAKPISGSSTTWQMTGLVSSLSGETFTIAGSGNSATITDGNGTFNVDLTNIPLLTVAAQSNDFLNVNGAFPRPIDLATGSIVGTLNVSAPVAGTNFEFNNGSVAFSGTTITFASTPANLNITGSASADDTFTITAGLTYSPSIIDAGGLNTLALLAGASYALSSTKVNAANLTVAADNSTLSITSALNLAALQLTNGAIAAIIAGGGNTLETESLGIDGTSSLAVNDNDVIIDYTGASLIGQTIADYLAGKIISLSSVSGLPTYLAIAESADIGVLDFSGVPVDDSAVLVKFTYVGDGNLDGQVDALDYERIDLSIGNSGVSGTAQGDFNYDGVVDGLDYEQVDLNVGNGVGAPLAPLQVSPVVAAAGVRPLVALSGMQWSILNSMKVVAAFSKTVITEDDGGVANLIP